MGRWGDREIGKRHTQGHGDVEKRGNGEPGKGKRQTHGNSETWTRRKGKTGRGLLSDIIECGNLLAWNI
jgi:hypothetical protein